MSDIVKSVYSQFNKKELLAVIGELSIDTNLSASAKALAEVIVKDLEENGLPEDLDNVSDSLYELLVVAEYIDEEGNLLEDDSKEEQQEQIPEIEQVITEAEIPDWICYSYADPRDPACNKCKLYDICWKKRISKRPECFGKLYDLQHAECQKCIESSYCKGE